ncbi:MAG: hypothetical protein KF847_21055 [Pirellulales bacterium]|nr:hypothetical protein [Pirellulales bacterium]
MAQENGQNDTNGGKASLRVQWAGIVVTILLAAGAMTVQWGVVTAKLQQVEKRLDELIVEARALRTEYQAIERRVSYLEGRLNGRGAQ